jgi:hypothetical protein
MEKLSSLPLASPIPVSRLFWNIDNNYTLGFFIPALFEKRPHALCLGLVVLYCISWLVTSTSRVEKILDSLRWYCIADYEVRTSSFLREPMRATFYREKYHKRLDSLTSGVFDWWDEKQMRAFLLPEGHLYDVRHEGANHSYLLAKIESKGKYKAEVPKKVAFDYYILGKKKIVPLPEYTEGPRARIFVSAGDRAVYIYRDSVDSILKWYFESLWKAAQRQSGSFCVSKNSLTISLYRDLQTVCEDIFVKKFYRNKNDARDHFIEEGFKVFLPTFLAMGARMVADQDLQFQREHRYLRALFTAFSLEPNFTMFYLSHQYNDYSPSVRKYLDEFRGRIDRSNPDEISLDQISRVARDILKKMEESLNQNKS